MEPSEPMGCTGQAQAVSEKEAVPPPPPPLPSSSQEGHLALEQCSLFRIETSGEIRLPAARSDLLPQDRVLGVSPWG